MNQIILILRRLVLCCIEIEIRRAVHMVLRSRLADAVPFVLNLRTTYHASLTVPYFSSIFESYRSNLRFFAYVFLRTVPSINLVKQRSINNTCDLC